MINEKKQLLFGFHVPSNNRYISLHIFCVLSESDATFNVGPLSIGPGLLERIMIFLVLIILVFLILPNESIHCYQERFYRSCQRYRIVQDGFLSWATLLVGVENIHNKLSFYLRSVVCLFRIGAAKIIGYTQLGYLNQL